MKIIFVGTKNFHFFSRPLLESFEKIILTGNKNTCPDFIGRVSKVIRVDEVYDCNSKTYKLNIEQCISRLLEVTDLNEECKVFCNQEANLEVAEEIRKRFSIYDHMDSRVEIFRDKILMKKVIKSHGLRVPHFIELKSDIHRSDYSYLKELLSEHFIIKPSYSVGSRGVYKVFEKQDFINFIDEASSDNCQFQAEEFISGVLYEFDTVLQNGELLYSNVSRYSCPMADLQDGVTLGSIMVERHEYIHKRIHKFGIQCLDALNALNGCFHMELFHSQSDELVFLEVAARSPGLMTVPAYLFWEGINMYDMELLIQSGNPASNVTFPYGHQSKPSFFIVYPKIAGRVLSLNIPEIEADLDIDWQVVPEQVVTDTTTNIDYAARFFVTCKNVNEAKQLFEWLTTEFEAVSYV